MPLRLRFKGEELEAIYVIVNLRKHLALNNSRANEDIWFYCHASLHLPLHRRQGPDSKVDILSIDPFLVRMEISLTFILI